jgi:hypothetical protein
MTSTMTKKTVRKRSLRKVVTSAKARVKPRRRKAVVLAEPKTYVTEQHWELC